MGSIQRARRDTQRYRYEDGYYGITRNPKRRHKEHKADGRLGKMQLVGRLVTWGSGQDWERRQTPVRGHKRRLSNGKTVNVRPHHRTKPKHARRR